MNGLALCAGVGGLELGVSLALGNYRTVCYVEREAFSAGTLAARMADGSLAQAPIWDDLVTFNSVRWRGSVDIITAGFPCQPFSAAGKRKGLEDKRWIWRDIDRIIEDVKPDYLFLENVDGLRLHGLEAVLRSISALGFDAEWDCLTANGVGASHRRRRLFVFAWRQGMADTDERSSASEWQGKAGRGYAELAREGLSPLADTDGSRRERDRHESETRPPVASRRGRELFPPGPKSGSWDEWLRVFPETEPAVCREADGLSYRVDRLRACGNGVVPLVAARAFRDLSQRAI